MVAYPRDDLQTLFIHGIDTGLQLAENSRQTRSWFAKIGRH